MILNLPGRLKLLILPASILYETIFVRQRELFINGFKSIYNVMAQRLRITGEGIMYYRIDADVDQTLASTSFFIFAGFIYMLVITYAVYCRPHFIAGLLVSFAPVEIGLYFGLKPSYPAFIAVAAYWAATVALGVSGCRDGDSRSTAGFIRKGNDFLCKKPYKIQYRRIYRIYNYSCYCTDICRSYAFCKNFQDMNVQMKSIIYAAT